MLLVIDDLIHGSVVTNDPARLLAAGTLVWLGNSLSFSLLYWLIDSGSVLPRADRPAARSGAPFVLRRARADRRRLSSSGRREAYIRVRRHA